MDNLDEDHVLAFFEENLLLNYNQLEWKNLVGATDKLKIIKRERKDEEIKADRKRERE